MALRFVTVSALFAPAVLSDALFPLDGHVFVNHIVEVNHLATTDIGFRACTLANDFVDYCYTLLGGDAITLAPEASVFQCACCVSNTPISPIYSTCATYLRTEVPDFTSEYTLWSRLYSVCRTESRLCGTPSTRTPTTRSALTTAYPGACTTMVDIITSCIRRGGDFTRLAKSSQAECLCYSTDRTGGVTWVPDDLDDAAASCASWARTGDPETAYEVAMNYQNFCHDQSAVQATRFPSTTSGEPAATEPPSATRVTTITVTPTPTTLAAGSSASALGKPPSALVLAATLVGTAFTLFAFL